MLSLYAVKADCHNSPFLSIIIFDALFDINDKQMNRNPRLGISEALDV